MISEGSCDIEALKSAVKAAENSALPSQNLKNIKYKTVILNCNNVFYNITLFTVFLTDPKLLNGSVWQIYLEKM